MKINTLRKLVLATAFFVLNTSAVGCARSAKETAIKNKNDLENLETEGNKQLRNNANKTPNILYIFGDQLSAFSLKAYGYGFETNTPNIDSIIQKGVRFANCYCPTPQCSPSRSSMFTGLMPHKTEIVCNVGYLKGGVKKISPRIKTVAHFLKDIGYKTAYIGKWHLGADKSTVQSSGFDYSDAVTDGGLDEPKTEAALKFLDAQAGKNEPWFLTLSFNQPHDICGGINKAKKVTADMDCSNIKLPDNLYDDFVGKPQMPYKELKPDGSEDDWRAYRKYYCTLIEELDSSIGEVLNKLRKTGQYQNTLIILSSDHGDYMGAHKLHKKGPSMFEEVTKVPMVYSWPGVIPEGESREQLTDLTDLYPTIVELLGYEAPTGIDGISIKDAIFDKEFKCKDYTIMQYFAKDKSEPYLVRAIVKDNFKYVLYLDGYEELYDLKAKPLEVNNLAHIADYTAIKDQLKKTLLEWIEKEKDPFFTYKDNINFSYGDSNPFFNRGGGR